MTFTNWSGIVAGGPWWLLRCGPINPSALHSHHAFQIVVHGGGPCLVDGAGEPFLGPVAVVEPDRPHAIRARRDFALAIFVEPTSRPAWNLRARGAAMNFGNGHPVAEVVAGLDPDDWSRADELVRRTMVMAGVVEPAPTAHWWRHPAVDETLLNTLHITEYGAEHLADLVAATGLSPDRLEQGFSTDTGIPLQSCARWLRLVRGCELLVERTSAADAARRANFVDARDLGRQLQDMLGLAPADIVGGRALLR